MSIKESTDSKKYHNSTLPIPKICQGVEESIATKFKSYIHKECEKKRLMLPHLSNLELIN